MNFVCVALCVGERLPHFAELDNAADVGTNFVIFCSFNVGIN